MLVLCPCTVFIPRSQVQVFHRNGYNVDQKFLGRWGRQTPFLRKGQRRTGNWPATRTDVARDCRVVGKTWGSGVVAGQDLSANLRHRCIRSGIPNSCQIRRMPDSLPDSGRSDPSYAGTRGCRNSLPDFWRGRNLSDSGTRCRILGRPELVGLWNLLPDSWEAGTRRTPELAAGLLGGRNSSDSGTCCRTLGGRNSSDSGTCCRTLGGRNSSDSGTCCRTLGRPELVGLRNPLPDSWEAGTRRTPELAAELWDAGTRRWIVHFLVLVLIRSTNLSLLISLSSGQSARLK